VALKISVILERKGSEVATIRPDAMLLAAAETLSKHDGALVVTSDGSAVEGIVSERDLVRELSRLGTGAVKRTVSDVMSREVTTCGPEATVDDIMAAMTQRRIRHVPIVENRVRRGAGGAPRATGVARRSVPAAPVATGGTAGPVMQAWWPRPRPGRAQLSSAASFVTVPRS
jgi:CBS domain-containing protein